MVQIHTLRIIYKHNIMDSIELSEARQEVRNHRKWVLIERQLIDLFIDHDRNNTSIEERIEDTINFLELYRKK